MQRLLAQEVMVGLGYDVALKDEARVLRFSQPMWLNLHLDYNASGGVRSLGSCFSTFKPFCCRDQLEPVLLFVPFLLYNDG